MMFFSVRVWATLITLTFSYGALAQSVEQGKELQPLSKQIDVPKITLYDGKRSVELSAFKGKFLLVNFWATWCSPCISEMPSLDRLAKKLNKENILVVAVSEDEGGASQVRPFVEKLRLHTLKILYDSNKRAFRDFGLRGLPTTYLINPDGRMVAVLEGSAIWDNGPIYDQIIKELHKAKK